MKLRNLKSFIEPRTKSSFNIKDIILLGIIILSLSIVVYLFLKPSKKHLKVHQTTISKNNNLIKLSNKLPNHEKVNLTIQKELTNLLSVVPYDMVLSSVSIKNGNSIIEGEIIYKDSYYKEIKPKLLQLYKYSNATMYKTSEGTYDITIKNKKIKKVELPKLIHKIYKVSKIKTINEVETDIKLLLPKNSLIKFINQHELKDYIQYKFKISTYIKSPQELYNIIEKINKKDICITLDNNMELNTYNSMIRIDFILNVYQLKKSI